MMNGAREANLNDAANALLNARRTNKPIKDLPVELRPETLAEAYFIQDLLAMAYEDVGGWKIGAPTPEATPIFAPMPKAWIAASGATLSTRTHRYRGLEAEIAFLLGQDLPVRAKAYTSEEVVEAILSCHPAIEVLESGLADPAVTARLTMVADLQMHGGFVYGPACQGWRSIDFAREAVTLAVDGVIRVECVGSNTSGDLMRLLPWLANEGATRTDGLKAGQWITTGSWTGNTQALAGFNADAAFANVGRVGLRFD